LTVLIRDQAALFRASHRRLQARADRWRATTTGVNRPVKLPKSKASRRQIPAFPGRCP